ncbi:MAG TPA: pyridoxamine 5'-phosphate oxidase family protein [Symbiobacteriaceae bacterium]
MQHNLQRKDRAMTSEETWKLLERGFTGRLGTADAEGWPYVVPLSYAVHNGAVYFHHTQSPASHLKVNVEANPRVCFEVDEPGIIFPTADNAPCETSVSFESVILYGHCTKVTDPAEKLAFFRTLMAKYADPSWERPDVWPMADITAVYRVSVERITGKRRPVKVAAQWQDQFPGQA